MLTRRRFLKLSAGACACCAIGGGYVAVQETTPVAAPFAEPTLLQPDIGSLAPDLPILLLINRNATPSFGTYLETILRAEGIAAFRTAFLDAFDPAILPRFAVVLLCPGPLTVDQAGHLERYVLDGGALVALQPDPQLAHVLGIRLESTTAPDGYVRIRSPHPITTGITDAAFQVHVPTQQALPDGAEILADLTNAEGQAIGTPLITLNTAGKGIAAFWGYDLARNIAFTRQGNPNAINQDLDPVPGIRTQDLFVGWAQADLITIPQADEQQRLLVNLLTTLCERSMPLPRLWYFPANADTLLIATGDAHGLPASFLYEGTGIFERYNSTISIYYSPPPISTLRRFIRRTQGFVSKWPLVGSLLADREGYPTIHDLQHWRERGHGFGMHPFVEQGLEPGINQMWNDFLKLGYGYPAPTTRTHRVLWSGWVDTARAQARYGIQMNLDYYQSGVATHTPGERVPPGFLNGSGLALPFVDLDGTVLDLYQQHTHLVDEDLMPVFRAGYDQGLSGLQAVEVSRELLDRARLRYPSALGLQFHFDPLSFSDQIHDEAQRWIDGTLAYAAANRIPTIAAERWLDFTRARTDTNVTELVWRADEQRLHIKLSDAASSADPLELLVPLEQQRLQLRAILINGEPGIWRERQVAGRRYAAVALPAMANAVSVQYQ